MISSFCESTKIISKFALEYKNTVFKSKLNFISSSYPILKIKNVVKNHTIDE